MIKFTRLVKILILVPIMFGGAIALTILSYLFIPLSIVIILIIIAVAIVDVSESTSNKQERNQKCRKNRFLHPKH